jgi:predicted AlkP superfamily phosphohydrolase/phosphomutase
MIDQAQMKVMILGADAPIVPRVLKYVEEGEMPHLKQLIAGGVLARNCLVPFPTITPPNWATIVTGAWPGTHGVTCFHVHQPGRPLDEFYPAFDSRDVKAEFIWEALGRVGKRSIVVNYPTSWPPRGGAELVQVAGQGLGPTEWRLHPRRAHPWDIANDLCNSQLFATEEYPLATRTAPQPPQGWASLPAAAVAEYALPLAFRNALHRLDPVTWWGLVVDDSEGLRLRIYPSKQCTTPLCELRVGSWSEKLLWQFDGEAGPRRGVFKFKLLALTPDAQQLKLFLSPICALDGYHHPPGLAEELAGLEPMPLPNFGVDELNLDWIDDQTWSEIMWEAHRWLGEASSYLLRAKPWDLFVMHVHCPDWAYHAFATHLDPLTEPEQAVRERFEKLEREFHRAWDAMLGTILAHADERTLVVVVSDHGATATGRHVPINKILQEAGLLTVEQTAAGPKVVWEKTRAVAQRSSFVYVNLAGRDPHGIVPPADYEQVRDQIITALLSYRDPEAGVCPFSMVVRREDARPLGIWGEMVGDVVFACRPEYGGQHGNHLPTAKWGIGSLEGLLILKGPGLKKGEVLERTAWITDVVPTVCYLAEWPLPKQAEGAILYQALADPDAKSKELGQLRRNYERLKRAYDTDRHLTHTYHDLSAAEM